MVVCTVKRSNDLMLVSLLFHCCLLFHCFPNGCPGTRTHTYLDPNSYDNLPAKLPAPSYLFTVTERPLAPPSSPTSSSSGSSSGSDTLGLAPVCEYGVCYVDSTTGSFKVGCFADGPQRNRLRTLLAKLRPKEVVYPHGDHTDLLSEDTLSILRAER